MVCVKELRFFSTHVLIGPFSFFWGGVSLTLINFLDVVSSSFVFLGSTFGVDDGSYLLVVGMVILIFD